MREGGRERLLLVRYLIWHGLPPIPRLPLDFGIGPSGMEEEGRNLLELAEEEEERMMKSRKIFTKRGKNR